MACPHETPDAESNKAKHAYKITLAPTDNAKNSAVVAKLGGGAESSAMSQMELGHTTTGVTPKMYPLHA